MNELVINVVANEAALTVPKKKKVDGRGSGGRGSGEKPIIIKRDSDNALIVYDRPRVFYDEKSRKLLEKCKKTLRCVNIFATAKLDIDNVDVIEFAKRDISAVFGPKFGSISHRLCYPKSMFSTYSKRGIVTCMGPKTIESAVLAIQKYVRYLNIQGISCQLVNINLNNVVYSVSTFPMDLSKMLKMVGSTIVNYVDDKESKYHFPAASINCSLLPYITRPTRIVLLVFNSGEINVTGAGSEDEASYVFELVFIHILIHVRVCQDNIRYSDEPTKLLTNDPPQDDAKPHKRSFDDMSASTAVISYGPNDLNKDILSAMTNIESIVKKNNL